MAYDSRCYDLAEVFLADEPALQTENKKAALAQTIQEAIETWIEWEHDHELQKMRDELNNETCSSHPCPPLSE